MLASLPVLYTLSKYIQNIDYWRDTDFYFFML
jgi:hypothetical protein